MVADRGGYLPEAFGDNRLENDAGERGGYQARPIVDPADEQEAAARPQGGAAVAGGGGWGNQVQGQNQGEAEEANWNPMEWDRPAEELTWERLLGLDGSLLFLEHVFWVISLNTLFIIVSFFCFCFY